MTTTCAACCAPRAVRRHHLWGHRIGFNKFRSGRKDVPDRDPVCLLRSRMGFSRHCVNSATPCVHTFAALPTPAPLGPVCRGVARLTGAAATSCATCLCLRAWHSLIMWPVAWRVARETEVLSCAQAAQQEPFNLLRMQVEARGKLEAATQLALTEATDVRPPSRLSFFVSSSVLPLGFGARASPPSQSALSPPPPGAD
jgi:hypothetical protein